MNKKMMKKLLAKGLALLLAVSLLVGCGGTEADKKAGKKAEVKEDRDAISVLVRHNFPLEDILPKQFPDIKFSFEYYDGWNTTSNLMMRVKKRDIPDVFFGTLPLEKEDSEETLIDLSGYEFCNNYENSILNQYDINGSIYQVPGTLSMRCIIYNREMFEKYGWEEPQNFGELAELCRQIRKDTDDSVTPIVFGGAGVGYYFTTMSTYAQSEYIYTPEGMEWERGYFAGEEKAEKGFGEGIRMMQELIDAGAFDYDKNKELWDPGIFGNRMLTEEAAMQFAWGGQDKLFERVEEGRFAVMPFRNRSGEAFIGTASSYNFGLSKRLEKPGNEKKLENALRVAAWFATEEGLRALTPVNGSIIFPLKDTNNSQTIPMFRKLWNDNLDSIKAPMLYTGYEDIIIQSAEYIIEAVQGKHTLEGLTELIDEVHQAALKEEVSNAKVYVGTFAEDFTHEETVQFLTDILHAKGDSDITLVSDGQRVGKAANNEGAHSRFYEGGYPFDWLTVSVPGNLSEENQMVRMSLTGAQIQELLEKGKNMVVSGENSDTIATEKNENGMDSSRYPYYWAGMTAELKDGKIKNMKLTDGAPIEADKSYTVTFAAGDYMDTTADAGNPEKLEYSSYDVFEEYMRENSPVSPHPVLRPKA